MGGNISMTYAGACPTRIRRLINVEGFGLAQSDPSEAPARLSRWLSELKSPMSLRSFSNEQDIVDHLRSEEHTSELQSLMRISYAVFCLKKKNKQTTQLN